MPGVTPALPHNRRRRFILKGNCRQRADQEERVVPTFKDQTQDAGSHSRASRMGRDSCTVTQDIPRIPAHSGSPPRLGGHHCCLQAAPQHRMALQAKQNHCGRRGYQVGAVGVQGTGRRRGALTSAWRGLPAPSSALGRESAHPQIYLPSSTGCPQEPDAGMEGRMPQKRAGP